MERGHSRSARLFTTAVAWSSLPLLFACLLVVYAWAVGIAPGQAYNSDQFHGFMLAQDLLADPSAVFDWYHSPAIYIVPDWVLAALPFILGVPDPLVPIVHGGVLLGLLCLAAGWLISTTGKAALSPGSWTTAAFLLLFAGAAYFSKGGWVTPAAFLALGAPVIHAGAILMALISAALFVLQLQQPWHRWTAAALAAAVFTTAFSDFTYLVYFAAPACVLGVLHGWTMETRRGYHLSALVFVAAAAGTGLERTLRHGQGVSGYLDLNWPTDSVVALAHDLWKSWLSGDFALLLVTMAVLALFIRSVVLLVRALRRRQPLTSGHLVELFLGGSCASSLLAVLALGIYSDPSHWRYFLIAFFAPLVWGALWFLTAASARNTLFRVFPAVGVLFSSVLLASGAAQATSRALAPSAIESCLMAEQRTTGISEYWPAKLLMMTSSRRIHLVQVNRRGNLLRWNYNGRWFHQRTDGTAAQPDFIILENLDPEQLRQRFGTPDRTVSCAATQIWLYDQPLRLFSSDKVYLASELPGRPGSVIGDFRSLSAESGEPGILSYGPYLDLAPGVYELRLRYSSEGSDHSWDLTQSSGNTTLRKAILADTGGEVMDLRIDVSVESLLSAVEFRTFFSGSGSLTVHEVEVRKRGAAE